MIADEQVSERKPVEPDLTNLDITIRAIEESIKNANGFSKPVRTPIMRHALTTLIWMRDQQREAE